MWFLVPRRLFLGVGAVVGLFVATPIIVHFIGVYAWYCLPVIAAYTVLLWFHGWKWVCDDDEIENVTPGLKVFYVLDLLFWTFIGATLLVFLGQLAIENWPAVVAGLMLLALVFGGYWISTFFDKKGGKADAVEAGGVDLDGKGRRKARKRRRD